jgi:hypothetical protein
MRERRRACARERPMIHFNSEALQKIRAGSGRDGAFFAAL